MLETGCNGPAALRCMARQEIRIMPIISPYNLNFPVRSYCRVSDMLIYTRVCVCVCVCVVEWDQYLHIVSQYDWEGHQI